MRSVLLILNDMLFDCFKLILSSTKVVPSYVLWPYVTFKIIIMCFSVR
jgi:hypothetical protein